jgi:hypothetical protein
MQNFSFAKCRAFQKTKHPLGQAFQKMEHPLGHTFFYLKHPTWAASFRWASWEKKKLVPEIRGPLVVKEQGVEGPHILKVPGSLSITLHLKFHVSLGPSLMTFWPPYFVK